MFAVWYGLSEKEYFIIADEENSKLSWNILNAFLCGWSAEEIKIILSAKEISLKQKKKLLYTEYNGRVCIYAETVKLSGVKKEDKIVDENGNAYKVGY